MRLAWYPDAQQQGRNGAEMVKSFAMHTTYDLLSRLLNSFKGGYVGDYFSDHYRARKTKADTRSVNLGSKTVVYSHIPYYSSFYFLFHDSLS